MKILPSLLALSATVSAYDVDDDSKWKIELGAGVLYSPTYLGDDEYQIRLLPVVDISYGETHFSRRSRRVSVLICYARGDGDWECWDAMTLAAKKMATVHFSCRAMKRTICEVSAT